MPQGQSLTVVKSEPLDQPALSVVKSEPLQAAGARPAATPPAAPTTLWQDVKSAAGRLPQMFNNAGDLGMAESTPGVKLVDPETMGGMVGAGVASNVVLKLAPEAAIPAAVATGVTRAIPWAYRAAAGAAGIAGAGAGGGIAALGEGKPLIAPQGQDSASKAAAWQAALQTGGMGAGWLWNAAGRRILGSRVASQAVESLSHSRLGQIEMFKDILTQAQDAIDSHVAQQAAEKVARGQQIAPLRASASRATAEARTAGNFADQAAARGKEATSAAITPLRAVASQATTEARGALEAGKVAKTTGEARTAALRQRWPAAEAAVAPPVRPTGPPPAARYKYQWPDDMGGGAAYEITDPAHPLAGSDVSAATLTEQGIPVPTHGGPPAGPVNYPAQAGAAAGEVIEGPAKAYKRQIGASVEEAAKSGPPVRTAGLQARLAELSDQMTPSVMQKGAEGAGASPEAHALVSQGYARDVAQAKAILAKNPDIATSLAQIPPELHLPAALSYAHDVVSTGETIPFADAHKVKRLLDEVVNWDRGAKKMRESATKGFRNTLRGEMAGHAPYDQATAAYRSVSRLQGSKQLAGQIAKVAQDNPEHLVNTLVNPKQGTKFRLLREVLTTHAAEGGGEAGAQAGLDAWHAVQSSTMYKHLIQPGIENFDKSVARMNPEFLQVLTGDPYAQQVFTRLKTMSEAMKASEARTAAEVAGHGATRQAALDRAFTANQAIPEVRAAGARSTAQEVARHTTAQEAAKARARGANAQITDIKAVGAQGTAQAGVERAALQRAQRVAGRDVVEARQPSADEKAFEKSTLGKPGASVGQQVSDVAYALLAPPASPRQIAGFARIAVRGPKMNDLIHWASLSDANTQMWVRAISSPNAGNAMAALARGVDNLMRQHRGEPAMAVSHEQAGAPPRKAATPPPGLPR